MSRNDDPRVILQRILDSIPEGPMDIDQHKSLKKVIEFFLAQVPLYELLDQEVFHKWDEVFNMKFPDGIEEEWES